MPYPPSPRIEDLQKKCSEALWAEIEEKGWFGPRIVKDGLNRRILDGFFRRLTCIKVVWDELQMGSGHAFTQSFRACKAYMGSTHCRFGLKDSLELVRVPGERYRGIRSPAKMKMGVSGCSPF